MINHQTVCLLIGTCTRVADLIRPTAPRILAATPNEKRENRVMMGTMFDLRTKTEYAASRGRDTHWNTRSGPRFVSNNAILR